MYDVVALGELLVDFIQDGSSRNGNPVFEANPGGAPCNVLAMLARLGYRAAFIGKVGEDSFGKMLGTAIREIGISTEGRYMGRMLRRPLHLSIHWRTATGTFPFTGIRGQTLCCQGMKSIRS